MITDGGAVSTLIEMMLALTLTVIIMGILVLGIQTTVVALERHRKQIEETHVARAVLARIAADIRCTVIPEEPELEGLDVIEGGMGAYASGAAGLGPVRVRRGWHRRRHARNPRSPKRAVPPQTRPPIPQPQQPRPPRHRSPRSVCEARPRRWKSMSAVSLGSTNFKASKRA